MYSPITHEFGKESKGYRHTRFTCPLPTKPTVIRLLIFPSYTPIYTSTMDKVPCPSLVLFRICAFPRPILWSGPGPCARPGPRSPPVPRPVSRSVWPVSTATPKNVRNTISYKSCIKVYGITRVNNVAQMLSLNKTHLDLLRLLLGDRDLDRLQYERSDVFIHDFSFSR